MRYLLSACFAICSAFSFLPPIALCSQYPIPAARTNTTSSLIKEARLKIAQDALALLLPQVPVTQIQSLLASRNVQTASEMWAAVLQDHFSNSTANLEQVAGSTVAVQFSLATYFLIRDALYWGLVDTYAYQTYNDTTFLKNAIGIWNHASLEFVLPEQAAAGQQSSRNVTIPSTCNGASTAGAVFVHVYNTTDLSVSAEAVSQFAALSGYLFEATGNATYLSYANLATDFIATHLLVNQLIADSISLDTCRVTVPTNATTAWTYDPGLAIEAWSVLADVTQNNTLKAVRDSVIYSSIASPIWTGPTGIIIEEPSSLQSDSDLIGGYKAIFTRGLHTAWLRSDPASDIAQLIAAYITVQYNALLVQSSQASQPNIYSASWVGPPPRNFEPYSQAIALHVLIPALTLANSSQASMGTPTSNGNEPSSGRISSSIHLGTGARAGIIIAAIAIMCGLGVLAAIILRRRRRRRFQASSGAAMVLSAGAQMDTIDPFTSHSPPNLTTVTRDSLVHRLHQKNLAEFSQQREFSTSAGTASDQHQSAASSAQISAVQHAAQSSVPVEDLPSHNSSAPATDVHQIVSQTVQGLMHALDVRDLHLTSGERREEPPEYEPGRHPSQ